MPIIVSGPGGYVRVSTPDLPKKIRGLQTALRKAAIAGTVDAAKEQRDLLSTGIRSGSLGLPALSPDTIRTRVAGKTPGATPAKPVKRGTNPLSYTGVSAKAIEVKLRSQNVVEISQPDNAFIGYSRTRMTSAAFWNEKGFNRRGRFTRKMLAYLHILFRKRGEKRDVKSTGAARVGAGFSSKVVARPAWEITRKKVAPRVPTLVRKRISTALQGLGLKANFD